MAATGDDWQAVAMSLLPDYSNQARLYDERRSASPSVMEPLLAALEGTSGRRLADIGGGTGNYSLALRQEGWTPVVIDRSPEMLARAADKGLETVQADARQLPFGDESFDAAMMISMLHHVEDRPAALAEARRVLRPGGRLVLMGFTREDSTTLWILDYFPSSRSWMDSTHPPLSDFLDELPGASTVSLQFTDLTDANLAALSTQPERLIEAAQRGDTSYFERMRRDHPEELRAGLNRIKEDINSGRIPRHSGTATLLTWTKPA